MKKVQVDSLTGAENVRAVLMRFVQTAKQQGYDDAYIEMVITKVIATDAEQLKYLLQKGLDQTAPTEQNP